MTTFLPCIHRTTCGSIVVTGPTWDQCVRLALGMSDGATRYYACVTKRRGVREGRLCKNYGKRGAL